MLVNGNATRGLPGGGPTLQQPRLQSEQIRDAVVAASWRRHDVIHSCCAPGERKMMPRERWLPGVPSLHARRRPPRRDGTVNNPAKTIRCPRRYTAPRNERAAFMNSQPSRDSGEFGQTPLSAALASSRQNYGDRRWVLLMERGRARSILIAMLSVPTLWLVFAVNFLALALVWTYVMRSYPNFAGGAVLDRGLVRGAAGARRRWCAARRKRMLPLVIGGTLLILACCLAAMGIQRFYDKPVSWSRHHADHRPHALRPGVLRLRYDDMPMRTLIYSLGQTVPIVMTLPLVLSGQARTRRSRRPAGRRHRGSHAGHPPGPLGLRRSRISAAASR